MKMEYNEWLRLKSLEYREGRLFFEGLEVKDLVSLFGTPVYVTSENVIRKRYNQLKSLLNSEYEKNQIHYAIKANSNFAFLKILNAEGSYFDCTSQGEVAACLKAGVLPERLIYTGNMFTNDDFKFAVKNEIAVNLDSVSQLSRLTKIYDELKTPKRIISFRVNPEFGAGHHAHTITAGKEIKFGILEDQVMMAYHAALEKGFQKFGIHQHIGSGIIDANDFTKATEKFLSIIANVAKKLKIEFDFLDFGGGLGIPYRPEENPLDLERYKQAVITPFKKFVHSGEIGEPSLKIEPGRYLSAESTILLTKINTIKDNGYKLFAGIDAGFNTLIRPTMYGSYHHIIPSEINNNEFRTYDIAGPICESGDILGKKRSFPMLKEGDILAILDSGAYGYAMSSNYNLRPRCAEILIAGGKAVLIRNAESFDDLFSKQVIPEHLK
jgi:diaminopimelate decarboxylase